MKKFIATLLLATFLTGCANSSNGEELTSDTSNSSNLTFKEARDSHTTELTKEVTSGYETPLPPAGINLELVQYTSDVGELDAYISSDPQDGEKHPLVIWVIGGWGNGISDFLWLHNNWDDDQSGAFFREAGVLTMYPSFRGGNTNPGYQETLYGEINDIYSAYDYALTLDYVDPERIYLVGHSTGATRALLASAYDDKFRAVFAFGPVDEIANHNQSNFTFDLKDEYEAKLRSPIHWLDDIKTPTFVIEGSEGNAYNINKLKKADTNDYTQYHLIEDSDHWSYLAPVTRLIADEILKDTADTVSINITDENLAEAYNSEPVAIYPALVDTSIDSTGLFIDIPAYWNGTYNDNGTLVYIDENIYDYESDYSFWSDTGVFIDIYYIDSIGMSLEENYNYLLNETSFEETKVETINGLEVYSGIVHDNDTYYKIATFNDDEFLYEVLFISVALEDFEESLNLIDMMYKSIRFE